MMPINYIDISGLIKTLPKISKINNIKYCEFLISAVFIFDHCHKEKFERFQVPIMAFKKYIKKCIEAYKTGKTIRVKGGLSWIPCTNDKLYSGFYICADTVTIK